MDDYGGISIALLTYLMGHLRQPAKGDSLDLIGVVHSVYLPRVLEHSPLYIPGAVPGSEDATVNIPALTVPLVW